MGRKASYYKQALRVLDELHVKYPQFELGRHLSTALAEYGDIWGMTGKEMLFALEKYQAELELDNNNIAQEDFVQQILEDGMNIDKRDSWEDEDEWEEGDD